ncbi:MAG TPA: hypothetical protein VJH03_11185 [Blastocatellia bacterium]|nr:hypothetical protein [Blastocatellia bacterium]
MLSTLRRVLFAPVLPNIAAGFVDEAFAVVDLRRRRGGFSLSSSALTQMPAGLVAPSFDKPNIADPAELAEIILQTAEAAGLANRKRWSVALPDGGARTVAVTLESKPGSRRELNEILAWKIERVIGSPSSELRTSLQRISPAGGQERYLVTVVKEEVIAQYESVFLGLGWQAGLLLPRHLGEAQWLIWDQAPGDKMLVSANQSGFTSVVVRNGEPVLIRTSACDESSRGDELHRFALYYRDRLVNGMAASPALTRLLILGGFDRDEAKRAIRDATDSEPRVISPSEFGLGLVGEPIQFDQLAGAAGLASIAYLS